MRASRLTELIALIGFVAGGLIASSSHGFPFYVGAALCAVSLAWYLLWGSQAQGWASQPGKDIPGELEAIEREMVILLTGEQTAATRRRYVALMRKQRTLHAELAARGAAEPGEAATGPQDPPNGNRDAENLRWICAQLEWTQKGIADCAGASASSRRAVAKLVFVHLHEGGRGMDALLGGERGVQRLKEKGDLPRAMAQQLALRLLGAATVLAQIGSQQVREQAAAVVLAIEETLRAFLVAHGVEPWPIGYLDEVAFERYRHEWLHEKRITGNSSQ